MRPLFWHVPHHQTTLTTSGEYMLGTRLLMASILQHGQQTRDIPAIQSVAHQYDRPYWFKDYPAPLETLLVFKYVDADNS